MNRKDAGALKPTTAQEAAAGSKPGLLGQRPPSCQAAAWPVIIEVGESVEEMGGVEEEGEFSP